MPTNTDLVINGITISDYASRGITITLNPIATGSLRRDVNGNLVDMTLPQFRKYAVEVSCNDHEVPELTGIYRGAEVEVSLPAGLGVEDDSDGLTMNMMVDEWQTSFEEWEAERAWRILLLQV